MLQKSFYKKSGFCQTFSFPVNWGFVYLSKLIVQYFRPFVIFRLSIMMINKNIVPDEKLTKEIKQTFFSVCKRYEKKHNPNGCSHSSVYNPYVLAKKFSVSNILQLNLLSYVVNLTSESTFLERVVYCFVSKEQFVVAIIEL